jgi:hypothetical protein
MIIPLFLPTPSSPFLPRFSSFHCHPFSHPTSSQHAHLLNDPKSIFLSFPSKSITNSTMPPFPFPKHMYTAQSDPTRMFTNEAENVHGRARVANQPARLKGHMYPINLLVFVSRGACIPSQTRRSPLGVRNEYDFSAVYLLDAERVLFVMFTWVLRLRHACMKGACSLSRVR